MPGTPGCPWRTAALPPIGGALSGDPEDFIVDELPAYLPSGEGTHWFVRIQKRGLSTAEAIELLARAAGCEPRDVGSAGRKDKHAVTTQWLSLPVAPVDPGDARLALLESAPHGNKLRMGHLRANRFTMCLRGLHPDAADRLPVLAAALAQGVPNYFGPQRFGRFNLKDALRFAAAPQKRVRDPRFLASVLQSAIFNRWLGARVADGLLDTALQGDVLARRETGGQFVCADAATDAERVRQGEVDPTGPLPGPRMREAEGEAAAREEVACAAFGTDRGLRALSRFAPGGRRVARLVAEDLELAIEGDTLHAAFTLPPGAFATTLLAELTHPEGGDLRVPG
ncbi:MAG: tRNA pseudouridine(13) synthase TruD, partial [Myxococcales bacterium]|nr:tRNA pseudouridine(13) synthase TruD [Myxococcales bacterium]